MELFEDAFEMEGEIKGIVHVGRLLEMTGMIES